MAADGLDAGDVRRWLRAFAEHAEAELDWLGELDRRAGDGDYGFNLRTALDRLRQALEADGQDSEREPFVAASNAFMGTGGTSGPLFGVWFGALGRAGDGAAAIDLESLSGAAAAGLGKVQRLGGASVGDKTMIDALEPATRALERAAARGDSLAAGLAAAAHAAQAGAKSTTDLVAKRGRAAYVGEVARGVTDPGAATIAIFFESAPLQGR